MRSVQSLTKGWTVKGSNAGGSTKFFSSLCTSRRALKGPPRPFTKISTCTF